MSDSETCCFVVIPCIVTISLWAATRQYFSSQCQPIWEQKDDQKKRKESVYGCCLIQNQIVRVKLWRDLKLREWCILLALGSEMANNHQVDLNWKIFSLQMDVYVFLFTDLLLITKAKKADKFKVIKPVS